MSCRVHELRVHYFRMKNITFSAEEDLIEQARAVARAKRKTLNDEFREWLRQYTRRRTTAKELETFINSLKHIKISRKYTREEMNER